jgi:hypothetical protein
MKRNLKPFTVKIKKSRVHSQSNQLPPRRLFEPVQAEVRKTIRKEEPQALAEQPAPRRILPSIVEPVWSRSEPVEPVRRKRSSRPKALQEQIELDLDVLTSKPLQHAPAETPVISEGMSQTDIPPVVEEDAEPVPEVLIREVGMRGSSQESGARRRLRLSSRWSPLNLCRRRCHHRRRTR